MEPQTEVCSSPPQDNDPECTAKVTVECSTTKNLDVFERLIQSPELDKTNRESENRSLSRV